MDNTLQIQNAKSQIEKLCHEMVGKGVDDKYEIRQEINLLEDEILRLEQEDEEGDEIILPVFTI